MPPTPDRRSPAPHPPLTTAGAPADPAPTSAARRSHGLTGTTTRRAAAVVWRGMRAHPWLYVVAVGISAVFGVATVLVGRVLGVVTDRVVVPAAQGDAAARAQLPWAGVALLGVALLLALTVAGRRIYAGQGFAAIQADHRTGVTRQLVRLPMAWHRGRPAGQLLSHTSADVEAATAVFNPLPFALGVVVMIVVAAVGLVLTDPWLALAALVVLPLATGANVVFQRRMSPHVQDAQRLRAQVADVAHESIDGAALVKALGLREREVRRFSGRADALAGANVRAGLVRAWFDPVIELLPSVGTLLVLGVGATRVAAGAIGTGDVVGAAYLLTLLGTGVRSFGWVLGDLPRALVGYGRIADVLDATPPAAPGRRRWTPERGAAAVRMRDVRAGVETPDGPVEILHGLDLDVPAGRVVAVVGPTGAGKTTAVSLVAGLSHPTTGAVLLDGTDLREIAPADVSRHVAYVSQQTFVFEDTVRGNVTLADPGDPGAPDDAAVWDALRLARVDDVVRGLPAGLDTPLGERGANLSGGQRQRLALARALVRRPSVLVLDDATSAVDPQVERDVLTGLRERGGAGPTVLLVAYRMSSVLLADEVVHVRDGRVVGRGTHAELLARDPGYRELATAYEAESARRTREQDDDAGRPRATAGGRA